MDKIDVIVKMYEQCKSERAPFEQDWKLAAMHVLPAQYASWNIEGPGAYTGGRGKPQRVAYDTTGSRSLPKYISILERLATPAGQRWHALQPSDENLRKKYRIKKYFDELSSLLFRQRYHPMARFRTTFSETYTNLGVYGNGPLFIGERKAKLRSQQNGIKYVSCAMRDFFALYDDDGNMTACIRRFWLNARQFRMKFGEDVRAPRSVQLELDKPLADESKYFEFIHYVKERTEGYDPESLNVERHPIVGAYICTTDKEQVGEDHGYQSMPYKMPRTATVSEQSYGYSPAVMALSSMGGASQIKKTHLKQGNKAVDPVLLAHDDGVANGQVDLRPGAINYGGVDRQGRLLIQALPSGNFRVGEGLLQDERRDIEDSFFVTLFQILTDTPEMTATEVMERMAEKASLLSPTMGRMQTELLGPTIEREIDILSELGMLPEMPPELAEAQGEYEVMYTSPLAKSMYAEEVSGFMRSVEIATNVAATTQDPSTLDIFDFDVALPEIADHLAVPTRWMSSPEKIEQTRAGRAEQAQNAELMKNAPALASAAKTATEAGMV